MCLLRSRVKELELELREAGAENELMETRLLEIQKEHWKVMSGVMKDRELTDIFEVSDDSYAVWLILVVRGVGEIVSPDHTNPHSHSHLL